MSAAVDEFDDLDQDHQQYNVDEGGETADDRSRCWPGGGIFKW